MAEESRANAPTESRQIQNDDHDCVYGAGKSTVDEIVNVYSVGKQMGKHIAKGPTSGNPLQGHPEWE
jgi:hypothetical protein